MTLRDAIAAALLAAIVLGFALYGLLTPGIIAYAYTHVGVTPRGAG